MNEEPNRVPKTELTRADYARQANPTWIFDPMTGIAHPVDIVAAKDAEIAELKDPGASTGIDTLYGTEMTIRGLFPVTERMIDAAKRYDESEGEVEDAEYFAELFRAMATARGAIQLSNDQTTWFNNVVKMLPEKDRQIAELRDRNSYLWERSRELDGENTRLARENADSKRAVDIEQRTYVLACDQLHATIAAKDARIAELDTELALLRAEAPKPDPKAEPKPVPVPNPFRDFPTDPRRMGP